jgi:hypothetical protein
MHNPSLFQPVVSPIYYISNIGKMLWKNIDFRRFECLFKAALSIFKDIVNQRLGIVRAVNVAGYMYISHCEWTNTRRLN